MATFNLLGSQSIDRFTQSLVKIPTVDVGQLTIGLLAWYIFTQKFGSRCISFCLLNLSIDLLLQRSTFFNRIYARWLTGGVGGFLLFDFVLRPKFWINPPLPSYLRAIHLLFLGIILMECYLVVGVASAEGTGTGAGVIGITVGSAVLGAALGLGTTGEVPNNGVFSEGRAVDLAKV
jgi:hypothetical protein